MEELSRGRLASWFTQWRQPLRRWLASRRRIPAAELDDVTQEVFLRLLKYDRVDMVDSPQAYLFRIAANVASEWTLKACNRQPHDSKWLEELQIEDQPSAEAMRDQSQSQIASAIRALPPRVREVLWLRYREGLSNGDIAARLKLHPQAVKRDLIFAYSRLRLDFDVQSLLATKASRRS